MISSIYCLILHMKDHWVLTVVEAVVRAMYIYCRTLYTLYFMYSIRESYQWNRGGFIIIFLTILFENFCFFQVILFFPNLLPVFTLFTHPCDVLLFPWKWCVSLFCQRFRYFFSPLQHPWHCSRREEFDGLSQTDQREMDTISIWGKNSRNFTLKVGICRRVQCPLKLLTITITQIHTINNKLPSNCIVLY